MDVKDMIGYKSPAEKMKTNTIDKLIGVKSPKFENLPPIAQRNTTVADFNLKRDIHINDNPIDVQDKPRNSDEAIIVEQSRLEKAFSFMDSEFAHPMDAVVPGYGKAGGLWNRGLASLGSKKHKRKVATARRHLIVGKAVNEGSKIAASMNPDVDPNLIHAGAGLTGLAVNKVGDSAVGAGHKYFDKRAKERKAKLKALGK